MTNLTLRGVKGTPLTNDEMDSNFSSLNNFKVEQTDSTGSALIPSGTTAQRDGSPSAGMFRYNTQLGQFEGYTTDWGLIGGGGLDSADLTNGTFTGKVVFDSAEFSGDLIVDTNTLFVDATNNKVLIGTAVSATTDTLQVNGTAIVGNTSLVESWIDIGRDAGTGGSRGALYLYGAPTGYSTGGTIYFYNAVDHDSNNSFYRAKTSGEDWVLELANGSDILTYDYSASQIVIPQSGGLSVTGDVTGANLTATNDLAVGQNDNTLGQVYIYGNGAGNTNGGELRLYTAADYDTNTDYYLHRIFQEDYYLQDQGFNTLLTYDHSAGKWSMPQSGGLSVTGDITAANISAGVNDTSAGILTAYGDGAGSTGGGRLRLYTAADHDTNLNYYAFNVLSEDLYIEASTGQDLLRYDWDVGAWYMGQLDNSKGTLYLAGDGTGSVNGGELRLYNAADHDTNVNYYSLYAESEDFLISYGTTDFLQYDYSASQWLMPQSGGLNVTGNITVGGTVDGRDIATDGTKLDTIDTNANAYVHPNHTGDVTSTGDGATTIANDAVTYAKIQNVVGNNVFLGNDNGAGAAVQELTAAEARTILNVEDGATADQTASEILTALLTVDGTGSGLDADLWDGNQFASYLDQTLLTTSSPSFTNITSTDNIYIGQNDTAFGQMYIYGNGTGSSTGGEMYLYTAADWDTNTEYYRLRVLAEDFFIQDGSGNTLMRHDHSANAWFFPTNRIDIGTNDTTYGDINVYGSGTGTGQGGRIRLYNAADWDTTNEGWGIKAWNDSLTFEKIDGTDIFVYNNVDNSFRFPAGDLYVGTDDVIKGGLYLFGEPTGGTAGGELFLYNSTDHQSSPNPTRYHFRTISGDFYITGNSTYLQYDASADQWLMPASGGLDVTGTITAGGLTVDTNTLHVDAAGNRVGIKTTSPALDLHVAASSNTDFVEIGATSDNYATDFKSAQLRYYGDSATGDNLGVSRANQGSLTFLNTTNAVIGTNGGSPLIFTTLSTERMRINSSGNVGIGTTTPATTLDVNGDVTLGGAVVETVYAISGTTPALDPANGTVQTWTLTAASTPTDSLAAGESMTLMIDDGTAYTVTWPTITWVNNGGTAPTLATTGYTVIALWKVSTTLYGALVGDGS